MGSSPWIQHALEKARVRLYRGPNPSIIWLNGHGNFVVVITYLRQVPLESPPRVNFASSYGTHP